MAHQLWIHPNGVLHGCTVAAQQELRQAILHARIIEVFQLYGHDPTIVAAASQHLFAQPVDSILARQRQYKLCWLRSVDAAITQQLNEVDLLRKQASRFFGGGRTLNNTVERLNPII